MQKVNPQPRLGQGTVPSCVRAPFERLISPAPAEVEALQAEEQPPLEAFALVDAPQSLLQDRGQPALRPHPRYPVEPQKDRTMAEALHRSLTRRAMRAVRSQIQGLPQEELWVVAFNERCLMRGAERVGAVAEGESLGLPLTILGWAEAKGARAIVLLQNQLSPREAAPPLDLLPTLKMAATAYLHGIVLVDHIILHATGAATHLRRLTALAEAQAYAVQLQTDLEDVVASHRPCNPTNPSIRPAPLP
jgi:RadC-like JAB domain-containing protein